MILSRSYVGASRAHLNKMCAYGTAFTAHHKGPLDTEYPAYSTREPLLTYFIGRVNDRSLHYH
jgi:hypothetical protein